MTPGAASISSLTTFIINGMATHDIQRMGYQPDRIKLLYTMVVADPARGLLNREKGTKEKESLTRSLPNQNSTVPTTY